MRRPEEVGGFEQCPPHPPPGCFAYDPEQSRFAYVRAADGEQRRVRGGPPHTVVLSPGDAACLVPIRERRSGCCGPSGSDGANLACVGCGAQLAIKAADCWTFQDIVLDPRRVMADG